MEIYKTAQEDYILIENKIHIVFDSAEFENDVTVDLSKRGRFTASIYGIEQVTKFKKLWEEIK